ncbi:MAG: GntR family transcriptional regulator [Planctomycetota bacterium]
MGKDKASQEEIYRQMRSDIENGKYPSSTRLPSVRTLAKRFSASPNTISKVVSRLMESGLCTARRGVGLFVRSLPTRKLTLLVGSESPTPEADFNGQVESRLRERLGAEGIEVERYHVTRDDPSYGPDVDRIRRPGRVVLGIGLHHEPHLKALSELRRPMLLIGHVPSRCNASAVVPNSFRSGYLAARHLIRKGYRRIAYIGRVRKIRQVVLPEPESLKELAGVQCAFQEEGLQLREEFTFPHIDEVQERSTHLREMPDAVIMPASEEVAAVQARKALGGNKLHTVLIGDDSQRERHARNDMVVVKLDELVDLAATELQRLLGEQRTAPVTYMVNGEMDEAEA